MEWCLYDTKWPENGSKGFHISFTVAVYKRCDMFVKNHFC